MRGKDSLRKGSGVGDAVRRKAVRVLQRARSIKAAWRRGRGLQHGVRAAVLALRLLLVAEALLPLPASVPSWL